MSDKLFTRSAIHVFMRSYDMKRGHFKNIEGSKLLDMAAEHFGDAKEEGDRVRVMFGAIQDMQVWTDGKALFVDMKMDPSVDNETAGKTIAAYNRFLEKATGFNAKQRAQRAQKEAKG